MIYAVSGFFFGSTSACSFSSFSSSRCFFLAASCTCRSLGTFFLGAGFFAAGFFAAGFFAFFAAEPFFFGLPGVVFLGAVAAAVFLVVDAVRLGTLVTVSAVFGAAVRYARRVVIEAVDEALRETADRRRRLRASAWSLCDSCITSFVDALEASAATRLRRPRLNIGWSYEGVYNRIKGTNKFTESCCVSTCL